MLLFTSLDLVWNMSTQAKLFIVATPIGNLDDFSFRAIEVLKAVDLVAAEDTRHSKRLLQHYQIDTSLISYHDHSDLSETLKLIELLEAGKSIALISDAGTPLISDPGYRLVTEARSKGIPVLPIPGASALTAALSVSGLPTDRFSFEGFLPAKQVARVKRLQLLEVDSRTLVFYESPHRILVSLSDMNSVFGDSRKAFIGRELTKKFESHFLGSLQECVHWVRSDGNNQKGEVVVVVAGNDDAKDEDLKLKQAMTIVQSLGKELSMKKAVALASEITGTRKNLLYSKALEELDSDSK